MAPQHYIQARKNKDREVVEVDGRPYWPFLAVDKESKESAKEVATKLLFGAALEDEADWRNQLKVELITGGNTNVLFCISGWKKLQALNLETTTVIQGNSILLRVFGAEGIIDRDVENATYAALWRKSLVPTYYGRFANGRIEQYLEGMRPLQDRQSRD